MAKVEGKAGRRVGNRRAAFRIRTDRAAMGALAGDLVEGKGRKRGQGGFG